MGKLDGSRQAMIFAEQSAVADHLLLLEREAWPSWLVGRTRYTPRPGSLTSIGRQPSRS